MGTTNQPSIPKPNTTYMGVGYMVAAAEHNIWDSTTHVHDQPSWHKVGRPAALRLAPGSAVAVAVVE
eukprot:CAMPEP_0202921014 /NCGR_PEP_ID=MMETSP1392-20130828/77166_1 /ASSEMBLY_ACC=CAM_ASM_000868 /TAXON_ID=225041 /ORGANISM="Chlamydomonas chlamydogama, Strain SAG 11-48b" /LENGTH=66 /DNA_ID=CAMNT_0049614549 /DNA_START=285 /DNA_END=485 /DNA_ORIENTATION=+